MKNFIFTLLLGLGVILAGCSIISSNYIPSSGAQLRSRSSSDLEVYYDKQEVPFKYKEVGRVFLKNINYWADRDPAGQIKKIVAEAAKSGADAVIIVNETRRESSFYATNGSAGGSAGDVFQYSGIAIVKQ